MTSLTVAGTLLMALVTLGSDPIHAACNSNPKDIIFVVSSSATDDRDFKKILTFVEDIVKDFDIGVYNVQVGLVIYSRSYSNIFYLKDHQDKADLLAAIRATYRWKGSNSHALGTALRNVVRSQILSSNGRRLAADLYVIVVSDGAASDFYLVPANLKTIKATDSASVTVMAVGVGFSVPDTELTTIASSPAHKFVVSSYGELSTVDDKVVKEICPGLGEPTQSGLSVSDCPAQVPRDRYLQVHAGVCYQFVTYEIRTFWEAEQQCEHNGGTLVVVRDSSTNHYLTTELYHTYHVTSAVWIGLKDKLGDESRYEWADGTRATYLNFGQEVGNDGSENCIAMNPSPVHGAGLWREYSCETDTSRRKRNSTRRRRRRRTLSGVITGFHRLRYVCQYIPTVTAAGGTSTSTTPVTSSSAGSTSIVTSPTSGSITIVTSSTAGSTPATDNVTSAGTPSSTSRLPLTTVPIQTVVMTMNVTLPQTTAVDMNCPPFTCQLNCLSYVMDNDNCKTCQCWP